MEENSSLLLNKMLTECQDNKRNMLNQLTVNVNHTHDHCLWL